jgi:hypothetical protein
MPLFSSGRTPLKRTFQFKQNTVMSHRRRSAPSQANCKGAQQKHSSHQGQVIAYEPVEHYTVLSPNEMAWLSNKVSPTQLRGICDKRADGSILTKMVDLTKCLALICPW